jgi:hypothetical protein
MAPGFRRDDVWTPVFTGVTTFYENIKIRSYIRISTSETIHDRVVPPPAKEEIQPVILPYGGEG